MERNNDVNGRYFILLKSNEREDESFNNKYRSYNQEELTT